MVDNCEVGVQIGNRTACGSWNFALSVKVEIDEDPKENN